MTHPTREQWMSYLHDEAEAGERGALAQHLNQCPDCRGQVNAWQETRRQLDTWKIGPPQSRRVVAVVWPRWAVSAAAAVMVLAAGLALGRSAGPSRAEVASLRAEVQQLKTGLNASSEPPGVADTRKQMLELATVLNDRIVSLQAQQASLRRELETVAVNTEAGFSQTESRFVQLASTTKPETKE